MSAFRRLLARRREAPGFVAAAVLTLVALLAWPFVDWGLRAADLAAGYRFWDFGAYELAVERWQAGEPLYPRNDEGGFHGTFLYPPVALLLFWPFTLIEGQDPAAWTWEVTSVLLLWVGLQLVVRELGGRLAWWERGLLLWAVAGFQPLLLAVKLGQTAPFLAALLCFAFVGLHRGGDGSWAGSSASGVATAVVCAVKPVYAPVGAHLLADRRRLVAALATGCGLLLVSLSLFGVETHRTYVDVLRWGVERGSQARSPALWAAPYYRPLAGVPGSLFVRVAASLAIASAAVLAPPDADREVFALGVAAVPLLAPLSYTYYLVALLPATAVLLAGELERPTGRPLVPVVGLLLAHLHAYGLLAIVGGLPAVVPATHALRPAYPFLQPGLWGNALLVGLAGGRVVQQVDTPTWIPDLLST